MAQSAEVISHWHQSVEGLSTSTQDYYAAVEKALREKEVPALTIERVITRLDAKWSTIEQSWKLGSRRADAVPHSIPIQGNVRSA